MKIIEPNVTEVKDFEGVDNFYHTVARAARICYASDKTDNNKELVERLIKSGHFSPFEHSIIYVDGNMINGCDNMMLKELFNICEKHPYTIVHHYVTGEYIVEINGRILLEAISKISAFYEMGYLNEALEKALSVITPFEIKDDKWKEFKSFIVDTNIGCTRELNRHDKDFYYTDPLDICEQSTRYCNFSKDKFGGEISVNKPYWFDNEEDYNKMYPYWNYSIQVAEKQYLDALKAGVPTDIARGILPLDTHTRAIYTSTIGEWQHIIDLRLKGTTGRPHGDIMIVANKINEILCTEK